MKYKSRKFILFSVVFALAFIVSTVAMFLKIMSDTVWLGVLSAIIVLPVTYGLINIKQKSIQGVQNVEKDS